MSLFVLGINHQTASIVLREKVAFCLDAVVDAHRSLLTQNGVKEAVIISTCNRCEIYCNLTSNDHEEVLRWLSKFHQVDDIELSKSLYIYQNDLAIQHLFRVACGLNSLILGEPQILGQIKQAFATANQVKSIGKVLNKWFQYAFSVAKKVRTDTQIGANAVSVAFAAVCLAKQIFSDLSRSRVLLIGAGETIELVGKYLVEHNVPNITIANRTLLRATNLVERFNAKAISLEEIPNHLVFADIIISSTASPLPIIGKGMVESALKLRRNQPMLFIDIAVPRDIECQVSALNDIYLYTVDDLYGIIEDNKQARQAAAIEAEQIIETCVVDFIEWMESLNAVESIKTYRNKCEEIRNEELLRALNALNQGGSPEKILNALAFKLTNKLIHHPSKALSQLGKLGADHELQSLRNALGLKN
ncbi:MAG: glutamyl-tRNA reductase [Psychromonas sp.]|nr:glutamyl-tRNA reductase [Psychromonas sp.]